MSVMDYTNAHSIQKSGQRAFLRGIERSGNPVSRRTNANGFIHWDNGWLKQRSITCKGVEISAGEYTGCAQTNGDCPICGL